MRLFACVLGVVLGLLAGVAQADSKTLLWDHSGVGISGYRGYCGSATGAYGTTPAWTVATAGTKTATVVFPALSRSFCVVRAYGLVGGAEIESSNSNELVVTAGPDAPTNLRLSLTLTLDGAGNILAAQVHQLTVDEVATVVQ